MRRISVLIFLLLGVHTLSLNAQLIVNGYTTFQMSGFSVLVEDDAFYNHNAMTNTAMTLMENNLSEIVDFCIDPEIRDSLQAVPIFMDWNTTTGAAVYHPSLAWLIQNGYIPEKAQCVEISNITNFVNWTHQNQPYMVLHELAHAYHHRVLNFNDPTITAAYQNAINQNLYTNIQYHNGNNVYTTAASAYGLNDEKEFFSELTEAYFGLNDYYPFDNADLQAYDPIGYNAVNAIWGAIFVDKTLTVQGTTLTSNASGTAYQWLDCNSNFTSIPGATQQSFSPSVNGSYAVLITNANCSVVSDCETISSLPTSLDPQSEISGVKVYPNPFTSHFTLDLGPDFVTTQQIEVLDLFGQVLKQQKAPFLTPQPTLSFKGAAGIYFIRVHQAKGSQLLKVIKLDPTKS